MRDMIAAIMAKEPTLNDFGFGLYVGDHRKPLKEQAASLDHNRRALLASVDRVQATCQWIEDHLRTRKTINPRYSSYGLKHLAEKDVGYITNGVFIAAMIACGFRYRVDGPNALFNVAKSKVL